MSEAPSCEARSDEDEAFSSPSTSELQNEQQQKTAVRDKKRPQQDIAEPFSVCLSPDAGQIFTPPPNFNDLLQVSTHQEQAVSAINRDVVELVSRQKVALNDVLEENQRLQIRYNNLAGSYSMWSKQVQLDAERELGQKMANLKDLLSAQYDAILGERTQQHMDEVLKLRSDNEKLQSRVLAEKEINVQLMARQQEELKRSQWFTLRLSLSASALVLALLVLLLSMYLSFRELEAENRRLSANFDALRRSADKSLDYLTGNGVKSGFVKMLKPNVPTLRTDVLMRL